MCLVYKSRLLIYDAGDTRTTWVSFWKAMALLQFGTTLVFAVPPLWNNENQPDPRLRKAQAIMGKTIHFISVISLLPSKVVSSSLLPFQSFHSTYQLAILSSNLSISPASLHARCHSIDNAFHQLLCIMYRCVAYRHPRRTTQSHTITPTSPYHPSRHFSHVHPHRATHPTPPCNILTPAVGILGTIPTLTMAYVTAPFVHQVFLQIPEHARRSRHQLLLFARSLNNPATLDSTANTKLELVTLRIFPFRKNTTAFLHELRALPSKRFRLANLEIPKNDEWAKRQREKGVWKRMLEVIAEPRYKFFVKEGKMFTQKTGVPGVWEEVAMRIKGQTNRAVKEEKRALTGPRGAIRRPAIKGPVVLKRPAKVVEEARVKRQTARSPK